MAFQPRLKADGTPCCFRATEDGGMAFPPSACQPCKEFAADRYRAAARREDGMKSSYRACCSACNPEMRAPVLRTVPSIEPISTKTIIQEEKMTHDYSAPNPYRGLAALKAASSTPESTFEDRWKAERTRELEATTAALDAAGPRLKTLTAAELAPYSAPNGYALALAHRSKEGR